MAPKSSEADDSNGQKEHCGLSCFLLGAGLHSPKECKVFSKYLQQMENLIHFGIKFISLNGKVLSCGLDFPGNPRGLELGGCSSTDVAIIHAAVFNASSAICREMWAIICPSVVTLNSSCSCDRAKSAS